MSTDAYIIRRVDESDGAFRFVTDLRPGLAPTITRDVRHAKRWLRKSHAERALAAFVEARGSDRDGFEVVFDRPAPVEAACDYCGGDGEGGIGGRGAACHRCGGSGRVRA